MKNNLNGVATKKDLTRLGKRLDGRMNFLQLQISEGFKTILERMGDLIERLDQQGKRQDAILEELRSNRIVLGSHEQRLQNVEFKVFPQT